MPSFFHGNALHCRWTMPSITLQTIPSETAMSSSDLDAKAQLILASETGMARQLALHVIEKPVPRVWMIFIPILFVLYFSKLKQFESALKDFVEHHLFPRRKILEAVLAAEKSGQPVNSEKLIDQLAKLDKATRELYTDWLTILAGHYQLLLSARGDSYPELVRSGYLNRENYLLFCQKLCAIELTVNQALLLAIEGNSSDLHQVTKMMDEGIRTLRILEADTIFS